MSEVPLSLAARKSLIRVLRLALSAPLQVEATEAGRQDRVRLRNASGEVAVEVGLLERAARSGLLKRSRGELAATPESRSFLRRQLSGAGVDFSIQHGDHTFQVLHEDKGDTNAVRVNLDHSPLASLARLKDRAGLAFLPKEALAAGERLHADFTRGQLQPCVTQTYEPRLASKTKGGRGGAAEISDSAMSARMRVAKALEAVGPELSGVALDICCFTKGLETVERERQWPARSAKLMLRTALMALHRHYTPPPRTTGMRHWGEDGYRPEL